MAKIIGTCGHEIASLSEPIAVKAYYHGARAVSCVVYCPACIRAARDAGELLATPAEELAWLWDTEATEAAVAWYDRLCTEGDGCDPQSDAELCRSALIRGPANWEEE